ncbi:dTDP-4-dehydrorhamnose 3,5-epimerase [Snodgrassella alvi]|uniref:dTDP-4-dehydrorhamnose 3,5-epimerase n=1 Tax=Snodgrassella alvi TaxID=1196083 RepID=UPI00346445FA
MKVTETNINGLLILEQDIYHDERGWFSESYNEKLFNKILNRYNQSEVNFVQDNHALSHKHVLRGLHYQQKPYTQAKLLQVLQGSIWDVAVDLREDSATYKKWIGIELSAKNKKQLWIPAGFAHGYLSLEDNSFVTYKTTRFYKKSKELCIKWNDSELKINWPINPDVSIILSPKDKIAQSLKDLVL